MSIFIETYFIKFTLFVWFPSEEDEGGQFLAHISMLSDKRFSLSSCSQSLDHFHTALAPAGCGLGWIIFYFSFSCQLSLCHRKKSLWVKVKFILFWKVIGESSLQVFTIKGAKKKDDDLQNGLIKQSFFETVFNMTLDIDGKIMGRHRVMSQFNPKKKLNFTISNRWDGHMAENTGDVKLSLEQGTSETVVVNILAPFFEVHIGDIDSYWLLF